jgi:hypothetical protein
MRTILIPIILLAGCSDMSEFDKRLAETETTGESAEEKRINAGLANGGPMSIPDPVEVTQETSKMGPISITTTTTTTTVPVYEEPKKFGDPGYTGQ